MARADRTGCPAPPSPRSDEEARLAELRLLDVLDTSSEERFDRVTRLASATLETGVALVSFLDGEHQWVKSAVGLERGKLPQLGGPCAATLYADDLLEIEDAHLEPGFAAHPLVAGAHPLRFYAGVALKGPHGRPVGTLCVLDGAPRRLDDRGRAVLRDLGRVVEAELQRVASRPLASRRAVLAQERCPLTQLLAKQPGLDRLEEMLTRATAAGTRVALIIADIVDFNAINSAFGRAEGDRVLCHAAHLVERTAPLESLVFRIQGDQFAVALELGEDDGGAIEGLLSALATSFAHPIEVSGHEVTLQLALGSAVFPDRASSEGELVDRAFLALRRAQSQRTFAEVFTNELEERLVREVAVEQALRGALAARRLSVAYQLKIDLATGRPASMEALCRWTDPELGFVSPGEFIPAAERTGLVVELGRQVLATAIHDTVRLRSLVPGFKVSVNVAAAQLQEPDFADEVLGLLEAAGAAPEILELEVVETSLIENLEHAVEVVERLRSSGVAFSLDDFGTGYSSLAYLHRLPVQTIKIDRGFIRNMTSSPRDAALVRSIISMAHGLDFEVVAEGVETEVQASLLRDFGCNVGQGFLWARPVPFDQIWERLQSARLDDLRPSPERSSP